MIDRRSGSSDPHKTAPDPGGPPTTGVSPWPELGTPPPPAGLGPDSREALWASGSEVLGELGRGGMGVVYLARNLPLNRPCALKTFPAGGRPDDHRAAPRRGGG
jgi:hypothetical protein